jgi:integrase
MSLFKRGNVFWAYVWMDGIRHHKSTGTPNRRKAELVEQQFKEELNLRRHHLKEFEPELRFGELTARFLANGSKAWHVDRLKVLLPYFADIPIVRISKSTVRDYRQWRHREKRLTDTTINRDLECLRHILFWAVDEGILLTNPLSRMRLERERKRKRPVLSLEEEAPLLEAAAPHLRPIIIAALDAGMRRGELLTQRWEDVDFARRLLFVTHSKTPEGESREIPLTTRLFDLLWETRENDG